MAMWCSWVLRKVLIGKFNVSAYCSLRHRNDLALAVSFANRVRYKTVSLRNGICFCCGDRVVLMNVVLVELTRESTGEQEFIVERRNFTVPFLRGSRK